MYDIYMDSVGGGDKTPRGRMLARLSQLKNERASWIEQWRELSSVILPMNGRFIQTDRNKGVKRNQRIKDSSATFAIRTLAAGMMSGMTSPARPWFRLTTSDPSLDEAASVKQWLSDVQRLMLMVLHKGNTYRSLHSMYSELAVFGTAASVITEDFDDIVRHYTLTCGEYSIATNYRGDVNTLYREFQKTVGELVGEFGLEKCSATVQGMFRSNNLSAWVPVVHAIEPRAYSERDGKLKDSKNKPFKSVYFEPGAESGKVLRESGFDEFPAVVPRWDLAGGDIYGTSPCMDALPDILRLQHLAKGGATAIDYQNFPVLSVPSSMKGRMGMTLPGVVIYRTPGSNDKIENAWQVNTRIDYIKEWIVDTRASIDNILYKNLFLMINSLAADGRMTAKEVAERHEEKLTMLGPVLERLHNELLNPLIENTFKAMVSAGIVPPAPQELQGRELNVEFVSMLAQAQRALQTNSMDRFVTSLGAIAQIKPNVLDKFDSDEWADIYADSLGIDPRVIVTSDKVALIRKQSANAQQAQNQLANMQQLAQVSKDLASAKTSEPSALTEAAGMFSGYAGG